MIPVAAATDIPLVPKWDTTSEAEKPHFRLSFTSIDPDGKKKHKSEFIKKKKIPHNEVQRTMLYSEQKKNQILKDKATYWMGI